ncbi:MAG: TonB-dependent receptor plug domain-containing protein, partial [Ferruginibacter sp.]
MRYTIVVIFLLNFFFCPVMAQHNFKGIVFSAENNLPLTGVTISVAGKSVTQTDSTGVFQFIDSSDKVSIHFTHIGYLSAVGKYAAAQQINVELNPAGLTLSSAIVKAFERNATLKNIPATVSVLGRTDLERYSNTSILQAVNTVPGVKMDERSPGSYRLSIRGNLLRSPFGVRNVKVYWNGMPFTDANGNTYLNQLGFENVGKIEIIKGPGGSLYGAGTGGVVLLSSRTADKGEHSIAINTLAGSWGTFGTNIAYKKSDDHSNVGFSYAHQQSDGWRTHTNM